MKIKKNQLLLLKLIIGLLVVLVLVSLGYFSKQYFKPDTVGAPTPTPTAPTRGLFQDLLTINCNFKDEFNYRYTLDSGLEASFVLAKIDPMKMPIKVDWDLLKSSGMGPVSQLGCGGYGGKDENYLEFLIRANMVIIYDNYSVALSHGGPPDFGTKFGEEIYNDGSTKILMYVYGGEGPWFVGKIPVFLRAEKNIQLRNGDKVYVSYSLVAIEAGDSRLVNFFSRYSKISTDYPGEKEVSFGTKYNELVKEKFFSDLDNLGQSEKYALKEARTVLNAVSAK